MVTVPTSVPATELIFQFKSPAFSGIGYSNHALTIDQIEHKRRKELEEKRQSDLDKAEREYKSTNIYKFQNNLESRIYAQLSKQIADSIFGEGSTTGDTDWTEAETPFGDTINWKRESDVIFVEIYNSNGTIASEFSVPVGEFAF